MDWLISGWLVGWLVGWLLHNLSIYYFIETNVSTMPSMAMMNLNSETPTSRHVL